MGGGNCRNWGALSRHREPRTVLVCAPAISKKNSQMLLANVASQTQDTRPSFTSRLPSVRTWALVMRKEAEIFCVFLPVNSILCFHSTSHRTRTCLSTLAGGHLTVESHNTMVLMRPSTRPGKHYTSFENLVVFWPALTARPGPIL